MRKSSKKFHNRAILEVENLRVNFHTYRGEVKALNGVNFKLYKGEVLALVGESGCGKSVTALTITGLLPENAYILDGKILFKGENLLEKSREEMRKIRVNEIAIVFQDPLTYLNPVLTIGKQLEEVFMLQDDMLREAAAIIRSKGSLEFMDLIHEREGKEKKCNDTTSKISKREMKRIAEKLCIDILKLVKLPDPERILKQYPFELSGGMRQRAMIAMALARRPSIFIADEITTALDVTIQAQILDLLKELKEKIDTSVLMITHDLSVAAEMADRIAVMYGGNVVEAAPTAHLFKKPLHPYTQMLLRAIPDITNPRELLESIPGAVPEMINPPPGCRFHPRCKYTMSICARERPKIKETEEGHEVACFLLS